MISSITFLKFFIIFPHHFISLALKFLSHSFCLYINFPQDLLLHILKHLFRFFFYFFSLFTDSFPYFYNIKFSFLLLLIYLLFQLLL